MSNPYSFGGAWGRHPEQHTSPDIAWSRCDGCPELLVKPREWAKHEKYAYHCTAKHEKLTRKQIYDMKKRDCPLGRELKRRRRFEP